MLKNDGTSYIHIVVICRIVQRRCFTIFEHQFTSQIYYYCTALYCTYCVYSQQVSSRPASSLTVDKLMLKDGGTSLHNSTTTACTYCVYSRYLQDQLAHLQLTNTLWDKNHCTLCSSYFNISQTSFIQNNSACIAECRGCKTH